MARRARAYRFIDAPPKASMRRRDPKSAPRLYEWLVDNGYAEPVTTIRSSRGPKRFTVRRKGRSGDHGSHATAVAAEKRIGRLVSMSNGKLKRSDFDID